MVAPLTAEDKKNLDAQLSKLTAAREMIKRAKMAGIDVATQEAEVNRLEQQIRQIQQAFFPSGR